MKNLLKIIFLLIIDFILIWLWFYFEDPDPSISIALIIIIPIIITINLLIAGILWVLKKKSISRYFILNSFIAPIITYFLWSFAINRHQDRIYETYSFYKNNKKYQINIYKPDNTFSINEFLNPGSSWSYQDGIVERENEKIILRTDSTEFVIINDTIIGFTKEKIKLKKE